MIYYSQCVKPKKRNTVMHIRFGFPTVAEIDDEICRRQMREYAEERLRNERNSVSCLALEESQSGADNTIKFLVALLVFSVFLSKVVFPHYFS